LYLNHYAKIKDLVKDWNQILIQKEQDIITIAGQYNGGSILSMAQILKLQTLITFDTFINTIVPTIQTTF
jgi:hypothetical protein